LGKVPGFQVQEFKGSFRASRSPGSLAAVKIFDEIDGRPARAIGECSQLTVQVPRQVSPFETGIQMILGFVE
jgi:hypothetical protein